MAVEPARLTKAQARRVAVRAQALEAARPSNVLDALRPLTFVKVDPISAIAPSADVVLWSRLGEGYDPAELVRGLERDRTLFELDLMVRPMEDLVLFRPSMKRWPKHERTRNWMAANEQFRRDILVRLSGDGPLPATELPDTSAVPWSSTGWTNDRNVTTMLECLMMCGDVAVSARRDGQRLWDLAERVYPDVPELDHVEAYRRRNERRLASLGILRERKAGGSPNEPIDTRGIGEPARVEGLRGTWRVDPRSLEQADEPLAERTALLSPLDRLVFDRARLADLFDYEYVLEMYKPRDQRRWGYWAMPILIGDRLVGKVDATADRAEGVLRVDAIHEDEPFTRDVVEAVFSELDSLAGWLGLEIGGRAVGLG
ncbi:DNA glycosylase AlkZ-like family protein [Agromyces sp. Marseille-P2726]|uniref:DNA glycosylase AlkZ-like family protein n=1 Tax=Agromyces sp. Marseille-P2726 TaxID=2709132 RepID=UPI003530289B